jgi:hypothetical protein
VFQTPPSVFNATGATLTPFVAVMLLPLLLRLLLQIGRPVDGTEIIPV